MTLADPNRCGNVIGTVRIAGVEADIHSCVDAATMENCAANAEGILTDFIGIDRVYIDCCYTDIRCGIEDLAVLVQ